jgi:hypothetical protein
MKVSILLAFFLFCIAEVSFGQATADLDLLKPTENFRLDSLDKIIKAVPISPAFLTINVWARTDSASVSAYGKEFYLLRVLTVDEKRFSAIVYGLKVYNLKPSFTGYFDFENKTILVYGNDGTSYFFTKTGLKKKFAVSNNGNKPGDDLGLEVHDLIVGYEVSKNEYKRTIYQKNYHYVQ